MLLLVIQNLQKTLCISTRMNLQVKILVFTHQYFAVVLLLLDPIRTDPCGHALVRPVFPDTRLLAHGSVDALSPLVAYEHVVAVCCVKLCQQLLKRW